MQRAVDSNTWLRRGLFALSVLAAGTAAAVPPLPSPHDSMLAEDAESLFDEAERARAHAQMPSTMYASTPSEPKPYYAHPLPDAAATRHDELDRAYPQQARALASGAATGRETAEDLFRQHISEPVVQAKCVTCHVSEGASGHTRLVFVPASTDGHETLNLQAFEDLLTVATDGTALVLDKIKGARTHGGGIQIAAGTAQYGHMRRFLQLLDAGDGAPVTVATLFDTVRMQNGRKTLYQAAVILAGRIPTDAEYASLGGWAKLRTAVRGLMTGPGFHEFLIRGANDRLLTDGRPGGWPMSFLKAYHEANRLRGRHYADYHYGSRYGIKRAPLELIAHVVERDLPYTEILTADYIMANPAAAVVYGHQPTFDDSTDTHEFRPVHIVGYYPDYHRYYECDDGCRFLAPEQDSTTEYPYAGLLNTSSLLYRHPTTPTNRNRARARWAYYHFLGVDVEQLGARALDGDALADDDNPTMNNPACTACHAILDPVAGTFQNYNERGWYRTAEGKDSLPDSYKYETQRPLLSRRLPHERTTVSVEAELDERTGYGIWFKLATDDESGGYAYLDKLTVLDANGSPVVEEELESMSYGYDEVTTCRRHVPNGRGPDGYFLLDESCTAGVHFGRSFKGFKEGTHRLDIVAWSSAGATLHTTLHVPSRYEIGDTWFRDMRPPGFNGLEAPDATNSLVWLGRRIAEDDRFAEATVKFWWPAIMGREVATPPTDRGDVDFEGKLLAAQSQSDEVQRLARMFRTGIRGGQPYNLKDLLTELVVSKWFMADRMTDADPLRRVALQEAGASRPLTPEELVAKTEALTGFVWGRTRRTIGPERDRPRGMFFHYYNLVYGGIDSRNVTQRNRRFNVPMGQVAKRHASQVAVPVVARDFFMLPASQRHLFSGIELDATPETAPKAIQEKIAELHEKLFGQRTRTTSKDVQEAYRFFVDAWHRQTDPPDPPFWRGFHAGGDTDDRYLEGILDDASYASDSSWFNWNWDVIRDYADDIQATEEEMRMMETWGVVLSAMLMDYRFLHL